MKTTRDIKNVPGKVATGKKKSTSIQKRATLLSEQLFAPDPLDFSSFFDA